MVLRTTLCLERRAILKSLVHDSCLGWLFELHTIWNFFVSCVKIELINAKRVISHAHHVLHLYTLGGIFDR